jgi:hypothetical protein
VTFQFEAPPLIAVLAVLLLAGLLRVAWNAWRR